jgi:predicted aspartyl protease
MKTRSLACAALAISHATTAQAPAECGGTVRIAEIHAHHVYLDARVNGHPARMILDSGGSTTLDSAFAAAIGTATRRDEPGQGGGEHAVAVRYADGVTLELGGARMRERGIAVVPLAGVARAEARRVDGILGGTLFRRCVVVIDYAGGTVGLAVPASYRPPAGWTRVPLERDGDLVFARATVIPSAGGAAATGWYEIDSGGGHALILNSPFVAAHRLAAGAAADSAAMVSVGGAARAVRGRVASLSIGGRGFSDVPALFSTARSGMTALEDFDGSIGGAILEQLGGVAFDYVHARMWMPPAPPAASPDR